MATATPSERYLTKLCRHTFLRLWSCPTVYRDQCWSGGNTGKEVCDLLVVFDRHIFIFSDKYCAFPSSENLALDWSRWFKRAILQSAKQIHGAERWLRQNPHRLFLDENCTQRFPIHLPPINEAIFHRVVVAHGVGERCIATYGGSGSLMLMPALLPEDHWDTSRQTFHPFAIGKLFESNGYIHVIDDFSLDILLKTLDTVEDLALYLQRKAEFLQSGLLISAAGEEELLAYYLRRVDANGEHCFHMPSDTTKIVIAEGLWSSFQNHHERLAQLEANAISYSWDRLIDRFAKHLLEGTQYYRTHPSVSEQEKGFRLLAREKRTRRRMLAKALNSALKRGDENDRFARVLLPSKPGDPHYVFLTLKPREDRTYDEYRTVRGNLLEAYCMAARLKFPDAKDVVRIATEPLSHKGGRSEDFIYMDASKWSQELEAEALDLQGQLDLFTNVRKVETTESEYPWHSNQMQRKGRNRNKSCPCGSGLKYKKCCGQ
jgi:hypothetical protein